MSTRTTDTRTDVYRSDEPAQEEKLQESQADWALVSTLQSAMPIDDGADWVEGVSLRLIETYADIAVRHATTEEIESGHWYASVVGLDGAWGDGDSPQQALAELKEAIVGWVVVKRRVGASDIPRMEGIDLNPPE